MLRVRHLSKTFPGTTALDDFEFEVLPGQVHALVGQNGSGKSTFIKILSGYHEPDPGAQIELDGAPLETGSATESRRRGLRFIHQDLGLVQDLSTVENLALGRGFRTGFLGKVKWREERAAARNHLADLGFDFDVNAPVGSLRAAERTGVAIARALYDADEARLLVIDEPTASLPRTESEILFNAIAKVQERGLGVVYVSHRLDEVFRIASAVTVLRDGRRVGTFDVAELDHDRLVGLMVGEFEMRQKASKTDRGGDVLLSVSELCGERVRGVDLEVRSGEIVGIAGLTGSGREEILGLLFGAAPRTGTVRVAGREIEPGSPPAAIRAGVGMVQADRRARGSVAELTVRENCTLTDLRLHSGIAGRIRVSAEREEVVRWVEELDIRPGRPEDVFGTLSGGNQQKVVLAKWLRLGPEVLLLDEPTQGVDAKAKATIHAIGREVANAGACVLVASTDDQELCDWCDRVVVLDDGEIVAELRGEEITPDRLAAAEHAV